jgi:general secretion pathway protein J
MIFKTARHGARRHRMGNEAAPAGAVRPSAADGFTLMEILVAVLILGIVVTTVLTSFNLVFSTTETLENSAAVFEAGKTALGRIVADLENIHIAERPFYKPPGVDDPPDPYRLQGKLSNISGTKIAELRLASRAHLPLERETRQGIAEVAYYGQSQADAGLVLRRADHLYPYPRARERSGDPVLCENVKSLAFTFVDAEGAEFETWDSDSKESGYATPSMVAVRLEILMAEEVFVFQTTVRLPRVRKQAG